ncbi:hypothetical protein A2W32_00515 [candidate division WWE3 bacterium RBG_16_37_10]|uniref:4-alpha-glucanotransferase n=1 Tax=candidate division WWE3 bacterium RBG_16_37_10 TaxID=1802610 RepID=A0A1F4V1M8_UNCKA|nr:MAG: hypothetical protein A2W32_00515 [candidate division WWE3 bacterium RBG_16_37_10]
MPHVKKDYSKIKTAHQWLKIGKKRRTGVLVPLFSIYSQNSIGIGEIPDLKLLADWCRKVNISIIQLLPLNDTGFKFAPYDTESSYAIDPMYICLSNLKGVESKTFYKEIELLKKRFKRLHRRVNYDIKKEKLKILGKMFDSIFLSNKKLPRECEDYIEKNNFWIRDYAIYKTLKDKYNQKPWDAWELKYKNREDKDISIFTKSEEKNIKFHEWLQWQLYLQMIDVKKYANKLGVLIMGDLPLLVSKDSADVWAHKKYFILDKSTGNPMDIDFIKGQRWGMPPYNWKTLEENKFIYFSEKLKYAEHFYNIYRIDHFIGLFRLWVIDNDTPLELGGIKGKYTPENPELWKIQGQKVIEKMLESTTMLPCGENLGNVPECANDALKHYLIPGFEVQRWIFKNSNENKINISIISTQDTSSFADWWENECGTTNIDFIKKLCGENNLDYELIKNKLFKLPLSNEKRLRWKDSINSTEQLLKLINLPAEKSGGFEYSYSLSYGEKRIFWEYLKLKGIPKQNATKKLIYKSLKKSLDSKAIFSIHLIQDWLSLGNTFNKIDPLEVRVNTPGTVSEKNWSFMLPIFVEKFMNMPINKIIKNLNIQSGRD